MPGMRWVVGVSVAVVLMSAYLTWTAARVDRLHVRVASAARALDAHLLRRAAAAAVLAEERSGIELYAAARIALDAVSPEEREAAENDLTRQLRATALTGRDSTTEAVVVASRRLVLARQVHTDLVRDALLARRRPLVRLMRFGRRHDEPRYFDIDDPTVTRSSALARLPHP
ncbi:hypothetical protein [Micromonospora sp. NBC_01813]|uniref:hypothetical protein n=1 Tax=Micromonospora sp. NBC_01813 TaxID=2975988 RepID=UPI002DD8574A|nr:hypothetical protein [Micromonospora sp. NBC_01813]WSA11028.1 hypothetical protein OG958_09780 [Micromonospora sp. NBC_01813]